MKVIEQESIRDQLGQFLSDEIREGNISERDWCDSREIDVLVNDFIQLLIDADWPITECAIDNCHFEYECVEMSIPPAKAMLKQMIADPEK